MENNLNTKEVNNTDIEENEDTIRNEEITNVQTNNEEITNETNDEDEDEDKTNEENEETQGFNHPPLYFTDLPFKEAVHPQVQRVFSLPQYEQRTEGWYTARKGLISASSAAQALNMEEEVVRYYIDYFNLQDSVKVSPKKCCAYKGYVSTLVLDKCGLGEPFSGSEHTRWGQKYEQVVSNVYSQLNQVDMLEFGLIVHPEYSFIGASPDGISTNGVMLEIKCPPVREIHDYPPLHYFIQMLIQLECTSLTDCDYMDSKFVEYIDGDDWIEEARNWEEENPDAKHHLYGIIMSYEDGVNEDDNSAHMVHSYPTPLVRRVDEFLDWAEKMEESPDYFYKRTYYKLVNYEICRVKANKEWFKAVLPKLKKVWEQVLIGRTPEGMAELQAGIDKKAANKQQRKDKKQQEKKDSVFVDLEIIVDEPYTKKKKPTYVHEECLL